MFQQLVVQTSAHPQYQASGVTSECCVEKMVATPAHSHLPAQTAVPEPGNTCFAHESRRLCHSGTTTPHQTYLGFVSHA